MYKRWLLSLVTSMFVWILYSCSPEIDVVPDDEPLVSDVELIMENIRQRIIPTAVDAEVENYMREMSSEGYWQDINYEDNTRGWDPQRHYQRILPMAYCYINPQSSWYKDDALYSKILLGIKYWMSLNLTSPNWYHNQINEPLCYGEILIAMRKGNKKIPTDLENTIIDKWRNNGADPESETGANRSEIAQHWMYFACLTDDEGLLKTSLDYLFDPVRYMEGEGFQIDGSFFQHGPQLYIGGYGEVLLETVLQTAVCVRGTNYSLSEEKKSILRDFVLNSWSGVIRGEVMHWTAIGRQLTRPDFLRYPERRIPIVKNLIVIDEQYSDKYNEILSRLQGLSSPDAFITPRHTHFFRGDYTLHVQKGYTFSLRMTSMRTVRAERGNGENNQGHYLSDGATAITIHGKEYLDLMPFWDWHKIPGVTAPINVLPFGWDEYGNSNFAGGVSNSFYGCSAYKYSDDYDGVGTSASKGYFFFDDEVICLGADINSIHSEVHTTVNQCWGEDGFVVGTPNGSSTYAGNIDEMRANNITWILHDGIGYFFPDSQNIVIENKVKTGNWRWISSLQEDKEIIGKVFTLGIEHPNPVQDGKYSYVIIPNSTTFSLEGIEKKNNIDILANTDSVQVVYHKVKKLYECIFYRGCTFESEEKIYASQACAMMIQEQHDGYVVHISDPGQTKSVMTMGIKGRSNSKMLYGTCDFTGMDDQYAGMTKELLLGVNTTGWNGF